MYFVEKIDRNGASVILETSDKEKAIGSCVLATRPNNIVSVWKLRKKAEFQVSIAFAGTESAICKTEFT